MILLIFFKNKNIFRTNNLKGKEFENIINSQLIINGYNLVNINYDNYEVDCVISKNNNLYLLEYKNTDNINKIKVGNNRVNLINDLNNLNKYDNIFHIIIWKGETNNKFLNFVDFLNIIKYRFKDIEYYNTNFKEFKTLKSNEFNWN